MVALARPAPSYAYARFGEHRHVIVYCDAWRAKLHVLRLRMRGALTQRQARELYREIK